MTLHVVPPARYDTRHAPARESAMRRTLPLLAIACLGFAPAPFLKPRAKPSHEIIGLWRGNYDLLVTANRMTYNPGGVRPYAYDLRLDDSARPHAYDITIPPGSFEGNGAVGIYRIEGDTLTVSYSPAGTPRPTAFHGPGSGAHTEVYRRVKR
ncbi:MAG: TIGR03067 domain-containing protein [Gemmataceae bacterium]|nr:TIGR03067 domain-containing protein [Gemmataceae bacterium]